MANLEKRVQVLFDEELYSRLQAEATAERTSVGAFIRDAVEQRLSVRRQTALEAIDRLFARVDEQPPIGPVNWQQEKDLMERESLRNSQ